MCCQSLPLYSQPKKNCERELWSVFQRVVIPTAIQIAYFMCLGISILYMIILLMSASHIQVIIISISTIRGWRRFREWYLHRLNNLWVKPLWISVILWFYRLPTIPTRLFHRHLSQTRAPQFVGCLICSFTSFSIALLLEKNEVALAVTVRTIVLNNCHSLCNWDYALSELWIS